MVSRLIIELMEGGVFGEALVDLLPLSLRCETSLQAVVAKGRAIGAFPRCSGDLVRGGWRVTVEWIGQQRYRRHQKKPAQ